MPTQDKNSRPDEKQEKHPAWLTILAVISLAFLVWIAFYFRGSFVALEEQLKSYQAAPANQIIAEGVYDIEIVKGQTIYVPTYSHIYADGGKPHLLETTLSIRNIDPDHAISIKSVKYFDTNGAFIRQYVDGEMSLSPLATAEFLVKKQDTKGGSGANFIVLWDAEEAVYEPLVDAVMVGFAGSSSISFTSSGRVLMERNK